MTQPTSRSLLIRMQDPQDQEAWERFVSIYTPILRAWLLKRGIPHHDAEDILQDLLELAMKELPQFCHNGRVGALRAWLRTSMSYRIKGYWRKRTQQERLGAREDLGALADALADEQSETSRLWEHDHRRHLCDELLRRAESSFSPQTVQAFRLAFLSELSSSEVAERLGMTPNAVRIAQSRVLSKLRELSEGLLED